MRTEGKLAVVGLAVGLVGVLAGFYTWKLTYTAGSPSYTAPVKVVDGRRIVDLKIMTVAAIGPKLSPNPDWVSYLVDTPAGWKRETVWDLPANATIHATIYNFDGASGLRNPYLARPQGISGDRISVDGKTVLAIDPNAASHTFAVPQLGVIVAVPGVADNAKNQCGYAPCAMTTAHTTVRFTFDTTTPGHYRWQCFVPCAAGWIDGFGGPMQTIGYMDGFLNVKA